MSNKFVKNSSARKPLGDKYINNQILKWLKCNVTPDNLIYFL